MGTGPFPGVKQPGRGVDQPPPYGAEVKERVELYLYSTSGPSWPVLGRTLLLPLPLFLLHSQHIVFHLHCSLVARDIIDRLVSVTLSICVVVETKPCLVCKESWERKDLTTKHCFRKPVTTPYCRNTICFRELSQKRRFLWCQKKKFVTAFRGTFDTPVSWNNSSARPPL